MNSLLQNRLKQMWLLVSGLLLLSLLVMAAPAPQGKQTGEVWASGSVTINGKPAVAGMTVATGSRIETGLDGLTAISLGKIGRVAVQAETNFLLNFQESSITGDLSIGNVVINIPSGITVQMKTPNGEVIVPVEMAPATLTVSVSTDGTSAFIKRDADRPRSLRAGSKCTPQCPGGESLVAKPGKATGEVWAVGNSSINGNVARSGATILSGSRIETGGDGIVANSLSAGRVAVQAGTNFLLNFQEASIAGNLLNGTVVINVANGATADVKTPDGEAKVLAEQSPATMTVGVATDGTHVFLRRDQDRPRGLTPATPLPGWVLPSLQAGIIGTVVTTLVTILPDPPDVTTFVPGIIFLL